MPAMTKDEVGKYMAQVLGWSLDAEVKHVSKDFKESMAFINKVADIAETEGHHPDIFCFYNKVKLELWTHAIGGLSENDFILAAKINQLKWNSLTGRWLSLM